MSISVEATGKYYTTQTTDFHFANYKFSFRKLQIFISFRSISFRFVSFRSISFQPGPDLFLPRCAKIIKYSQKN